jgi:hypothetical protein
LLFALCSLPFALILSPVFCMLYSSSALPALSYLALCFIAFWLPSFLALSTFHLYHFFPEPSPQNLEPILI